MIHVGVSGRAGGTGRLAHQRWPGLVLLLFSIILTGCREIPKDAVAAYDGGEVTRAEAVEYLQSGLRPKLRDDGAISEHDGVVELVGRYAAMEILASEVEPSEEPPAKRWLHLDERARALVRFYVEIVGKQSFEIPDEEVRSTYEELVESRLTLPEKVTFQHVFLRRDRHAPSEFRRIFATIRERMRVGASMDEMVAEHSESASAARNGVVGPVFRGKMDPAFEDALFAHDVSDGLFEVEMDNGFHLIRMLELFEPRLMTFEEARPQVVSMLMDERSAAIRRPLLEGLEQTHGVLVVQDWRSLGPDEVAVRVGDRTMTRAELDRFIELRTLPSLGNDVFVADYEASVIGDLVGSNLMYLDAVDRGLDADPIFVSRWRLGALRRAAEKGRSQRFGRWAETVTDEEVRAHWEEDPGRFSSPPRFDVSYVFVPFGDHDSFSRLKVAEELGVLLADDERSEELDHRCIETGARYIDLGVVTGRQTAGLGPEVQRTLVAMEPHRVSKPIRVEGGLVVLGLGDA
ncbi:MAG: peptidylprolyl isomerase, partial [Acidobacteriota bacterium]